MIMDYTPAQGWTSTEPKAQIPAQIKILKPSQAKRNAANKRSCLLFRSAPRKRADF